jgi:hypothetical protein
MDAQVEEFLEHYGKKGMKWGVRTGIKENADFKRGQIKGIYRTPQSGKTQSRKVRFGKRLVSEILLPGVGGMLYNGIARPLKPESAKTIGNQSKIGYGAKTALSILGGPAAIYEYQQIARPVGPHMGPIAKRKSVAPKTAPKPAPKKTSKAG